MRQKRDEAASDSSPFCCLEELNLLTTRKLMANKVLKPPREELQFPQSSIQQRAREMKGPKIPYVQRERQAAERRKMRNYILSRAEAPCQLSAQQRLEEFKKKARVKNEGILDPVLSFKKFNIPPSFSSSEIQGLTDRARIDFKSESGFHNQITWEKRPLQLQKAPSISSMKSTRVDTDCLSHEASCRNRFSSRPQSSRSYRCQAKIPSAFSQLVKQDNDRSKIQKQTNTNLVKRAVGKSKSVCKLRPYLQEAMKPISLPFLRSKIERSKGYQTERVHVRQNSMLSTFHNVKNKGLPQLLPGKKECLFPRRQALDALDAKM